MPAKPSRPKTLKKKPNNFFDSAEPHSQVKAAFVAGYVPTWASIMLRSKANRVLYIDLYAGRGKYDDGSPSTPLILLKELLYVPILRDGVATWFSDSDGATIARLDANIKQLPDLSNLKHPPVVQRGTVDDSTHQELMGSKIPTFAFLDPFGYKGLSAKLVHAVIKDWGCECMFYFNYNRIRAAIDNPMVRQRMTAIFGEDRSESLRSELKATDQSKTEAAVLQSLADAMNEIGGRYVLPFRFKNRGRTTHHLVFVTKSFTGLDRMREVMSKHSTSSSQNVPSFEFVENDNRIPLIATRPLDELQSALVAQFAGQSVEFKKLYEEHSVDAFVGFLRANYREAICNLMDAGSVTLSSRGKTVLTKPLSRMPAEAIIHFK
jgi:three-Cys-motif partner protein